MSGEPPAGLQAGRARGQRDLGEVARQREQGPSPRAGVDRRHHHRVRPKARAPGPASPPIRSTVSRPPRARPAPRRAVELGHELEGQGRRDRRGLTSRKIVRDRVVGAPLVPADEDVRQRHDGKERAEDRGARRPRAGAAAQAPGVGDDPSAREQQGGVGGQGAKEDVGAHGLAQEERRPLRGEGHRPRQEGRHHRQDRDPAARPPPVDLAGAGRHQREARAGDRPRTRRGPGHRGGGGHRRRGRRRAGRRRRRRCRCRGEPVRGGGGGSASPAPQREGDHAERPEGGGEPQKPGGHPPIIPPRRGSRQDGPVGAPV